MSYFYIHIVLLLVFVNSQNNSCSKGCQYCFPDNKKCSACQSGWEIDTQGKCYNDNSISNCAIFLTNSIICQSCKPTFKIMNGTCIKDYKGCYHYSGRNCTQCGFGTTLKDGSCTGVLNCKTFADTCSQCETGYVLNGNICYYIGGNCAKVDVVSGACLTCKQGYNLMGYSCIKNTKNVENCYLFDQNLECLFCKIGYVLWNSTCIVLPTCNNFSYLNQKYQCTKLPFGCSSIDNQTFTCNKCNINYQLINSTCLPTLPNNCFMINQKGVCTNCSERMFAFNFTCQDVSKLCKNYTSDGRCTSCSIQNYMLLNGICKDPFCINATAYDCLTCRNNFIVSIETKQCILIDFNCRNLSNTVCWQCYDGYYISFDICQPMPDNCVNASKDGSCLLCMSNNYMQFNKCFPVNSNILNCRIYSQMSTTPVCIICEAGFIVSLGNCVLIPPFCNLVLTNGKCVMCQQGFTLTIKGCVSANPKIFDPNCLNITDKICLRCSSTSVLGINGVCYPKDDTKCQQFNKDGSCSFCLNGYAVSRGMCLIVKLIDINCKQYNNNVCLQCYDGFYLSKNQCRLPNANCSQFNQSDGGCLSCYSGFTLTNNQCVLITKKLNCIGYDGSGNCLQCSKMFYLKNSSCTQVNPLCQTYNTFTGACTSCFLGFAIDSGSCVKKSSSTWSNITNLTAVCKAYRGITCIQCPYRYFLRDNGCNLVSTSCENYNPSNGMCLSCRIGYFMSTNVCVSFNTVQGSDPNCKTFLNQQECLECYNGFVLLKGQCQGTNPLCKTTNLANGKCDSCYEGYSLNSGDCLLSGVQPIIFEPCTVKNSNGSCQNCIVGYRIQKGSCIYNESGAISNFNIPFCHVAVNSSYCSFCSSGFYSVNGICYQVSAFCLTYDPSNGNCLSCKQSYIFQKGSCIFPAMGFDYHCENYSGVYCSKCSAGFYLKDYICRTIDIRCLNFNFDINQCVQCSSGVPSFDICS